MSYDELGRSSAGAINSVAVNQAYDALGRVTTETKRPGDICYAYDGVTARLASVTYPNAQTSSYSYLDNVGDRRLQTIITASRTSRRWSSSTIRTTPVGNIVTWQQQADSAAPTVYRFGCDAADQLTAAINQTTDPTPTIVNALRTRMTRRGTGRASKSMTR